MFMLDRVLGLFAGFTNSNDEEERKLYKVLAHNISNKFFIEIFVSFAPQIFFETSTMNTILYSVFKLPRYLRIFEMDDQIDQITEFYRPRCNVTELKKITHALDILKFLATTLINLHLLTCVQIVLCKHRSNFEDSWMGGQGVEEFDAVTQYIIAIYFVTTTLSTCGFGDISATKRDATESAVVLFLQFVGMLFYSMTIQKVQSFMVSEEITAGEYANFMVEVVENLIVKVGRQLPSVNEKEMKIPGEEINKWKNYTLKYFQLSPNAFLAENEFYKVLSSNMQVKIVKENLMLQFQERFEVFFRDDEFQFKADAKLITQVIASLSYEHFESKDSILRLDVVSQALYFIYDGQVEVSYKDSENVLLIYDQGSYIGDTSYIF